jgi:hypothetical protein
MPSASVSLSMLDIWRSPGVRWLLCSKLVVTRELF